MELIGNVVNLKFLGNFLPPDEKVADIDYVLAAIAYGSEINNPKGGLVDHCVNNKLRLDLWMRYDHTIPVTISLLDKLNRYQSRNIFTNFIPDCFHTKAIWWKGYGAYIGSANHTERAWHSNLELGVFFSDEELIKNGLDLQLDYYFEYLKNIDKSIPISSEYIDEMKSLKSLQWNSSSAKRARKWSEWRGPSFQESKSSNERGKDRFKKEWNNALGILKTIEGQLRNNRPVWVNDDVPLGWQVDQFLHAYYYNKVGDKQRKPFEEYFKKNHKDPALALQAGISWWASLKHAPSKEDITFDEDAPIVRALLSESSLRSLSAADFEQVFCRTHATKDYMLKVSTSDLGRPDVSSLNLVERLPLFAKLIMNGRNAKGWDIRELLYYVLYDGSATDLWERLFHAGRDPNYKIRWYGLNSLAEVAGWARPEVAPPRNGRTSKALRALGYDVKIY